jgi:hypothetical protein
MSLAVQVVFTGLSAGGVYGLIAIGHSLIYRLTGIVHFALGDLIGLGAFISLSNDPDQRRRARRSRLRDRRNSGPCRPSADGPAIAVLSRAPHAPGARVADCNRDPLSGSSVFESSRTRLDRRLRPAAPHCRCRPTRRRSERRLLIRDRGSRRGCSGRGRERLRAWTALESRRLAGFLATSALTRSGDHPPRRSGCSGAAAADRRRPSRPPAREHDFDDRDDDRCAGGGHRHRPGPRRREGSARGTHACAGHSRRCARTCQKRSGRRPGSAPRSGDCPLQRGARHASSHALCVGDRPRSPERAV